MTSAAELRRSFLDYFASFEHQIVSSSPLVPKDDPSLLFTNAGMVPFKKVFLGQEGRNYTRAVSSQKCLRVGGKHNDLENVGRTARHHTFFEMLGNFSFGDYFKEEAIYFAWKYLTKELQLPSERLYISVYKEDEEAAKLWKKVANVPSEKIYWLDEKENYWSMGDTGPCGPCSEILIDQGSDMACGPKCEIGVCDCDRFLELWNLVFMQYNKDENGQLNPLPHPNIDTGMGLERISAVCQGVYSNFDTDLFKGMIQSMAYKAKVNYGADADTDTALRVIADHCRAIPFMIADGILPANEGRGYVLRRLVRRAYRFGKFLGMDEPFLYQICEQMVGEMGEAYPELRKTNEFMTRVIRQEEENFGRTLDNGLVMLEDILRDLDKKGVQTVPGESVFKLYDTYGFPVDIVKDVAEKKGYAVDEQGFEESMRRQKERSKASWAGSGAVDLAREFDSYIKSGWKIEFIGYEHLECSSRIVEMMDTKGGFLDFAGKQDTVYVITARTPFYGESGGQVGDSGRIESSTGKGRVVDTLQPASELIVHKVEIDSGKMEKDQEVSLLVDQGKRVDTARNHTSTHMLHAALRKIIGEHVKQSGSLVSSDRLRFDFTHINPLTSEEIREIESEVNKYILADLPVDTSLMSFEEAKNREAIGLFEEKYAEEVRVVEISGVSRELCGGTHLRATGQAGLFFILAETGVASGIRRIEAATGWNALNDYREKRELIDTLAESLKAKPEMLQNRVKELQEQLKQLSKEKEELETKQAQAGEKNILDDVEEINGLKLLAKKVDLPESAGMKGLRNMMDELRTKFGSGAILLATESQGKAMLILHVSKDLHQVLTAPDCIKDVAEEVGGSGGGRPDLAQAGGSDPSNIDRALEKFRELIKSQISSA